MGTGRSRCLCVRFFFLQVHRDNNKISFQKDPHPPSSSKSKPNSNVAQSNRADGLRREQPQDPTPPSYSLTDVVYTLVLRNPLLHQMQVCEEWMLTEIPPGSSRPWWRATGTGSNVPTTASISMSLLAHHIRHHCDARQKYCCRAGTWISITGPQLAGSAWVCLLELGGKFRGASVWSWLPSSTSVSPCLSLPPIFSHHGSSAPL